jgi:hypothetical protein
MRVVIAGRVDRALKVPTTEELGITRSWTNATASHLDSSACLVHPLKGKRVRTF